MWEIPKRQKKKKKGQKQQGPDLLSLVWVKHLKSQAHYHDVIRVISSDFTEPPEPQKTG